MQSHCCTSSRGCHRPLCCRYMPQLTSEVKKNRDPTGGLADELLLGSGSCDLVNGFLVFGRKRKNAIFVCDTRIFHLKPAILTQNNEIRVSRLSYSLRISANVGNQPCSQFRGYSWPTQLLFSPRPYDCWQTLRLFWSYPAGQQQAATNTEISVDEPPTKSQKEKQNQTLCSLAALAAAMAFFILFMVKLGNSSIVKRMQNTTKVGCKGNGKREWSPRKTRI